MRVFLCCFAISCSFFLWFFSLMKFLPEALISSFAASFFYFHIGVCPTVFSVRLQRWAKHWDVVLKGREDLLEHFGTVQINFHLVIAQVILELGSLPQISWRIWRSY